MNEIEGFEKFTITCNECGSKDVKQTVDASFEIDLTCRDCQNHEMKY